MRTKILLLIIFSVLTILRPAILSAQDNIFEVSIAVDKDEVPLSGSIRLDITFAGIKDMPAVELPQINGFKSNYLRSANIITKSNGKIMQSSRHTYILMPQEQGAFRIGPLQFQYEGNAYSTKAIDVRVTGGTVSSEQASTGISKEEQFMAKENTFILIEPQKDRVYINEVFPLEINAYFKEVRLTDIQFPIVQHEGFSIGEFRPPQKTRKNIKDYDYHVVSFRTNIFATKPGELKLGPATLSCNLLLPRAKSELDDTSKKEPFNLESITKQITVQPLPEENKPQDFSGAIGDFNFKLKTEPAGYIRVGDTIRLRMEIDGKGNFAVVSPPPIKADENFIIYEPSLKEEGDTYKIFEQVLIPKRTSFKEIPQVRFSFFNPQKGEYATVTQGPISVNVLEAEKPTKAEPEAVSEIIEKPKEESQKPQEEIIGKDIIYIKESSGIFKRKGEYAYKNRGFWFFQILPLFGYVVTLLWYKHQERLRNDIGYARRRVAYKKAKKNLEKARQLLNSNKQEEFYQSVFVAIQEYIGDKFNMPAGGITSRVVDEALAPKGFRKSALDELRKFFNSCDMARFTPSNHEKKEMAESLSQAERILEYFQNA